MDANKANTQTPQTGLSVKQLNQQLDQFEGQKVQFEQAKMILEFDKKNYADTLNRKIRLNDANLEQTISNINVVRKQIKKAQRNHK